MTARGARSSAFEVENLREFRRELNALGPQWSKELRNLHKTIATEASNAARSNAAGLGGVHASAALALRPRWNTATAAVTVRTSVRPYANVAFWGSKEDTRTGWYADISGGAAQHPSWVGAGWEPGVAGQGPYAINDAVASLAPQLLDRYGKAVEDITRRAFPD